MSALCRTRLLLPLLFAALLTLSASTAPATVSIFIGTDGQLVPVPGIEDPQRKRELGIAPQQRHFSRASSPHSKHIAYRRWLRQRFRRANPLLRRDLATAECTSAQILAIPGLQETLAGMLLDRGGSIAPTRAEEENGGEKAQRQDNNCTRAMGKLGEVKPDMSLELRSLCAFEKVDSVDPKRLPQRIPQVRCVCSQPRPSALVPASMLDQFLCEPVHYDVQVIHFDAKCAAFRTGIQRVTLACVPALKARARSNFEEEQGQPENEGAEV